MHARFRRLVPLVLFILGALPLKAQGLKPSSLSVCFTPGNDCTFQIIGELGQAKQTIHVQAFSFTSAPIAKALAAAARRGVKVEVILDKENFLEEFTQTKLLIQAGIPIYLDGGHQTAHNKVILVDGKTVITGSFNFTKAAQEKNAENLLILKDPDLAQAYLRNWETHRKHSERLNSN
jgi:phosphatidylserine/phosphatidylglycerophosphate/cardiolipin synthase-like enzyme